MCWHICNNCNEINNRDKSKLLSLHPCIWFIINEDESGLQGCPYYIPGEDNEMIDPACWISVPFSKIQELMDKYPDYYKEGSDEDLDEEELNYSDHQEAIKRMIG